MHERADGQAETSDWILYGSSRRPPLLSKGTAERTSGAQRPAVPVRSLRVGFVLPELGEAAWTARDLL